MISKILRLDENTVVSLMIKAGIDILDEEESSRQDGISGTEPEHVSFESTAGPENTAPFQRVSIGSKLPPMSFQDVLAANSSNQDYQNAFKDLRVKVCHMLEHILPRKNGRLQKVTLRDDSKVCYLFSKNYFSSHS